ncbi:MAG: hypothetical protein ACPGJV_04450 [Bacteriovoracaceae bacterium]
MFLFSKQVEADAGQMIVVTAIEIQEDVIIMDGNHPLAGETLHFDVDVISIREATEQELAQGHI